MLQFVPLFLIAPETVTGAISPFGGHKEVGVVEIVIVGAVVQKGVSLSSTPTPPFAMITSGFPSPFKSPTATDSFMERPESKVTGT
jgi:hypothetical protein